MNKIEKLAFQIGRLRRLLKSGDAPIGDQTAWMDSRYWGEGLLQGNKPRSKVDALEQFTSWVYICANLNAKTVASVPLTLYVESDEKGKKWTTISTAKAVDRRRMTELGRHKALKPHLKSAVEVEEVTGHPFNDLMRNVNPFMNQSDLMELTCLSLDLTGEAYWYVIKNKLKVPGELWPIPSQYMTPIPGATFKEFIKGYHYERGRVKLDLDFDEVISFVYPNPNNQLVGMSCVRGVMDAIYTNSKMYEYEEKLFEQKARTGGVLETSADISEQEVERLREDWRQRYAGTGNAGQTAILPPGLKFVKDTMTNEELSFIEGRRITREEIMAGFDVPSAMLDPSAIRANVEGGQYYHAKYGIEPRLRKIEEKLNERLLPMFDETGRLFCAFDDCVPEDSVALLAERTQYVNAGIMARNEARADMGLEAVEGGDDIFVPFNMVPLGQAIAEPEPESEPAPVPPVEPEEETDEEKAARLAGRVLEKIREKLA